MGLGDIIQISVTVDSPHVTRAGFGTPLILSTLPNWAERTRIYTDLDGMVADGFGIHTPEYLAAQAIFSQDPRVERLKVGRGGNKPTQRFKVVPTVVNLTRYAMKLIGPDGVEHEAVYTSDANATAQEIIDGLKAAIDAFALAMTTSNQGPNTSLRMLANNIGDFFSVEIEDASLLLIEQDHADPGVAADLGAIALADPDWYGLVTLFNSTAVVAAAAAWVETQKKVYTPQSQQGDILTASVTDIATTLKTAAYKRTSVIYHPKTSAFIGAAWLGKDLPFDPGSETWMFKTLAGVPAVALTPNQRSNALGKNANVYETQAGVNITENGTVADGEYLDVIRFIDWLQARMQERIFTTLVGATKIPYTDKGIAAIEADVRAQLQDGVDVGGLSDNPKPTVTVPLASSVSGADKAARTLRNVKFKATLAGAIHYVAIAGSVSV